MSVDVVGEAAPMAFMDVAPDRSNGRAIVLWLEAMLLQTSAPVQGAPSARALVDPPRPVS